MMSLGGYTFSVKTTEFQELERKHSWRWVTHDRLFDIAASHYQGPNAGEITLNGVIYVESSKDLVQLANMKAEGQKGTGLRLLSASNAQGTDWGLWCMLELTEKQTYFLPDGTPTKFTFSIRLKEYGSN